MTEVKATVISCIIANEGLSTQLCKAISVSSSVHTLFMLFDENRNNTDTLNYLNDYDLDKRWRIHATFSVTYGEFDPNDKINRKNGPNEIRNISCFTRRNYSSSNYFQEKLWHDADAKVKAFYPDDIMDGFDYTHAMDEEAVRTLINSLPHLTSNDSWVEIGLGYPRLAIALALHFPEISIVGNDIGNVIKHLMTPPSFENGTLPELVSTELDE